jgi:hypothetical protein
MSHKKYRDAELILKLYDLRREEVMRKARTWLFTDFNPESVDDIRAIGAGEFGAYFRMVTSYWDMACSLVKNGAIDAQMFDDANGEHIFCFVKIQPFLEGLRTALGQPGYLKHLEAVVMSVPNVEQRLENVRQFIKRSAAHRAEAAKLN